MKHILHLLAALLLSIAARSQDPTTTLRRRVDSTVESAIKADQIPGAVVQIQKDGRVIYSRAYGLSQKYDIHHQPLPQPPAMNTATLFDLASLTKVVGTTTSLMLLADQHKLSVDDPVSKYLPGFDSGEKKQITLRHLLTHTAGLYEWYPLYYRSAHRDSTIRFIESLPLHFPVGKQRKYSDLGFMLLGAIVEKVSGLSLDRFEEQYVFKPLGMIHTGYNPLQHGRTGATSNASAILDTGATSNSPATLETTDIAATSLGQPYEYRMTHDSALGFLIPSLDPQSWNGWRQYVLKGEVNDGNAFYSSEGISGAAGLFSTISDLQLLVNMLLNNGIAGGTTSASTAGRTGASTAGRTGGRQFISAATIRTFLTPDSFHNGLGWMMDPVNAFMKNAPAGTFGHTGFTGTSISVVPEYHLSIIILINRQNTGLLPTGVYYNPNPVRQGVFDAVMEWCSKARF